MRYYKREDNNYILSIGIGEGGTEITETEYNEIMSVIQNKQREEQEQLNTNNGTRVIT